MKRITVTMMANEKVFLSSPLPHVKALLASTSHILATTTRRHSSSSSISINKTNPPSVTLYQYKICPFCNINKALLNYINVPYEKIEVNPLTKSELKSLQSKSKASNDNRNYKKVPIAIIDNEPINDSTEINNQLLKHPYIIHNLESTKWNNTSNKSIKSIEQFASSNDAIKWIEFANKELAPILYPNICKSLSESYDAFGYVHDVKTFTPIQKGLIRVIGSFAMYIAASKIKCMY
jgi:microsomal prostaglandin-E synthase 2